MSTGPVIATISDKDTMFAGDASHYFSVGRSAMDIMRLVVGMRPGLRIGTALDMACGYGRVLRHMRAAWPEAVLHACDIDPDAVSFCEGAFGARPILSHKTPEAIRLPTRYDLIWVGSLLTHVNEDTARAYIRLLTRSLSDQGVCLLSSHGHVVCRRMTDGRHKEYGLLPEGARRLVAAYEDHGYGYQDYDGWVGYGVSCIRPGWFFQAARAAEWRPLFFMETAWDNHHDVVGVVPATS